MILKDNMLVCPVCNETYGTHLTSVNLYNAVPGEDRLSAILQFSCECGQDFNVDIKQHEGTTLVDYLKGGETNGSK